MEKDWIEIRFVANALSRISALLSQMAGLFSSTSMRFYKSEQQRRVIPWFRDNGDSTLRLNYDLNPDSVVFDVGGYQGRWASDISNKYDCNVYVFEPVQSFAADIRNRFLKNPRVNVLPFGLGPATMAVEISIDKDASSMFVTGLRRKEVKVIKACEFINSNRISKIDLMKINIEGGEYDLLDHLLDCGLTDRIINIQVQFHDFVPNAEERMRRIQDRLRQTHSLTYQYPFVWENWRLTGQPRNGSSSL